MSRKFSVAGSYNMCANLFDALRHDVFDHSHLLRLAHSQGASNCLFLDGGVPLRFDEMDAVGDG